MISNHLSLYLFHLGFLNQYDWIRTYILALSINLQSISDCLSSRSMTFLLYPESRTQPRSMLPRLFHHDQSFRNFPCLLLTIMISANLQGLVSSHDQSDLVCSLVLQKSYISSSTFLPFLVFLVESE